MGCLPAKFATVIRRGVLPVFVSIFVFALTALASAQDVSTVAVNPSSIVGGQPASGTVTLDQAAGAGGLKVKLFINQNAAFVPSFVIVPSGQSTANFDVISVPVDGDTKCVITARGPVARVATSLLVKAPTLTGVTITPGTLVAGRTYTASVTISSAAGPSGASVALVGDGPALSFPSTVMVPPGEVTIPFTVQANSVAAATPAKVTGSLRTSSRSRTVTVKPASLVAVQWPKFRNNLANTAVAKTPVTTPEWRQNIGLRVVSSPAIRGDGTVIVGSTNGFVYALDPYTGVVNWKYKTGGRITASPVIGDDGNVYVGSADRYLYALKALTGELVWRYKTGGAITAAAAVGSNGGVVVGSFDRKIYCLNRTTGLPIWTYLAGGAISSSPTISNEGTTVVGSNDGRIYALDVVTGALKWTYQTDASVESSPAIGTNGVVYVGSDDGAVYAIALATGAKKWSYQTDWSVYSSPCLGPDNTVYVGSDDGNVYALNGTTGNPAWTFLTGDSVGASPALNADGILYVESNDGYMYGISAASGNLLYVRTLPTSSESSPAIIDAGVVVIGLDNGDVVRMDTNVIYESDFAHGNTVGWNAYDASDNLITTPSADANPIQIETTPTGGRAFLGQFGTESARLSLHNVVIGKTIRVKLQLFIMRSWDGSPVNASSPDRVTVSVRNGPTLLDTTFANFTGVPQNFPDAYLGPTHPAKSGASEVNTLGFVYNGAVLDCVYNIDMTFTATTTDVDLDFRANLPDGIHTIGNESWGIGHLRIVSN